MFTLVGLELVLVYGWCLISDFCCVYLFTVYGLIVLLPSLYLYCYVFIVLCLVLLFGVCFALGGWLLVCLLWFVVN